MVQRVNQAAWGLAFVTFLLSSLLSARGAEKEGKNRLARIGLSQALFRGTDSRLMLALMQPLSELFSSQTGVVCEFTILADPAEIGRDLDSGQLQFGIMHGIDYAWIRNQYPDVRPLLLCSNGTIALKGLYSGPSGLAISQY
jgi:ABC-type phosphate/phosphonate transport system substrate-binding protein